MQEADNFSPHQESGRKLQSWKEIAGYLRVGVSTAQRWEKEEALPVYRHKHVSQGTVHAFTAELDAWLHKRSEPPPLLTLPGPAPQNDYPLVVSGTSTPPPANRPSPSRRIWIATAGASALAGLLYSRSQSLRKPPIRPILEDFSSQLSPRLSPDGRRIVLREDAPLSPPRLVIVDRRSGNRKILPIKPRMNGLRWSRDARSLAFLHPSGHMWDVSILPLDRVEPRLVTQIDGAGLDWAPNPNELLVTDKSEAGPLAVYAVDIRLGARRQVTRPSVGSWGDIDVAVSNDNKHFAVVRYAAQGDGDIWLCSWDHHQEKRLTNLHTWFNGLTFHPDGSAIIFSAISPRLSLFQIPVEGGKPGALPTPGFAAPLLPHAQDDALVFMNSERIRRLHRGTIRDSNLQAKGLFTPSLSHAEYPAVSPSGKYVAWTQASEVWISKRDGTEVRRLAHTDSNLLAELCISPDDAWLLFTANTHGMPHVYLADVKTGATRRLTQSFEPEGRACWSPDGRYIYWRSIRDGASRFYRRDWPSGSTMDTITLPATALFPSIDNSVLYFLDNDQRSQLYRVRMGSSSPPLVLKEFPLLRAGYVQLIGNAFVYGQIEPPRSVVIYHQEIGSSQRRKLALMPVSPDSVQQYVIAPDLSEAFWIQGHTRSHAIIMEDFIQRSRQAQS